MVHYQKKFHLQYKLPDGNIWRGFINITTDTLEQLPDKVYGVFMVEKVEQGWHGLFALDDGLPADRRSKPYFTHQGIITTGVHRPDLNQSTTISSTEEAQFIIDYGKPVQYTSILPFVGRLEDCVYATETHKWE